MAETVLTITRSFQAPPEQVFDAFADAAEWWAPPGARVVEAELAFEPGGRFRIGMESPDGTVYVHGTFETLERPRRLVFTHVFETDPPCGAEVEGAETRVEIELVPRGEGTELRFRQAPLPSDASRESVGVAFGGIFDGLARHLAREGARSGGSR